MPTIMSKLFNKPAPRELYSRPKSHGGYWIVGNQSESDLPPLHPFQWCCVGLFSASFLTMVVTILWQIVVACSAGSDSPPDGVLAACLWSVGGVAGSLLGLLTFNFLRKP